MKRIVVEHLTKTYQSIVTQQKEMSFREVLINQATSFFKQVKPATTFNALEDISFEVQEGEVLGIIGKNGSGKSTLLKILSKITAPTSGKVTLRGRVASLLEVGTGFHGELSGRENIYLSGIILGMKRWEIAQQFDEIVAFSGVENFLDVPVKKYSSGMRLRLAFSVAAYLNPEILLIDEVLAVGDYEFEKKCLDTMGGLSQKGRTILFVSHNILSIKRLCSQVMVLEKGVQKYKGAPDKAFIAYLGVQKASAAAVFWKEGLFLQSVLLLNAIKVLNMQLVEKEEFFNDQPVIVQIQYKHLDISQKCLFILSFYDDTKTLLFTSCESVKSSFFSDTLNTLTCVVPAHIFQEGIITIGLSIQNLGKEGTLADMKQAVLFSEAEVLSFSIVSKKEILLPSEGLWQQERGKIKPLVQWQFHYENKSIDRE